jgi:hypothetical protein
MRNKDSIAFLVWRVVDSRVRGNDGHPFNYLTYILQRALYFPPYLFIVHSIKYSSLLNAM